MDTNQVLRPERGHQGLERPRQALNHQGETVISLKSQHPGGSGWFRMVLDGSMS